MNCKGIRKKLLFFIDKELPADEEKIVAEHLKTCNDCIAVFNKLKSTLSVIEEEKKIQVNQFLFTGIEQKIKDLESADNLIPIKSGQNSKFLKPIYLTLIFAIAILIGIHLGNKITQNYQPETKRNVQYENTINTNGFFLNDTEDEIL